MTATKKRNILVTGASGNLGSKVAKALLNLHSNIIVNGRKKEKLEPFESKAKIIVGDLEDKAILHQLLENTQAVFLVMPVLKKTSIKDFAASIIEIASAYQVSHVVNISNCTLERWGQPTPLIEFEHYLSAAKNLHIKHLRCANFFENLNWGIHTPYRADIKLPYISSFEVAHVAAQFLSKLNFSDTSVEELMGSRDYSMKDFSDELGVTYKQLEAPEELRIFFDAFNSGNYKLVQRTTENTSKLYQDEFSLKYFLKNCFDRSLLE